MQHTLIIEHEYDNNVNITFCNEYKVTFEFYVNYTPANFNGHPDNWCDAEYDSDWNIINVVFNEKELEFDKLREDVKSHLNTIVDKWVEQHGENAQINNLNVFDYDDCDYDCDFPDNYVPDNYDPYGGP